MDLKSEFITSLLTKNYGDSLKLCKIILRFAPDHELAKEYLPVLEEMITLQQRNRLKNFKLADRPIFIGIENFKGLKSDEDEDDDEESTEDEDDSDLSSDSDTSGESEDEENLADSVENGRTHSGKART